MRCALQVRSPSRAAPVRTLFSNTRRRAAILTPVPSPERLESIKETACMTLSPRKYLGLSCTLGLVLAACNGSVDNNGGGGGTGTGGDDGTAGTGVGGVTTGGGGTTGRGGATGIGG